MTLPETVTPFGSGPKPSGITEGDKTKGAPPQILPHLIADLFHQMG